MTAAVFSAVTVLLAGCGSKGVVDETVATVNGNKITVLEVREAIGIPGGVVAASMFDIDQKKKVIDQIADARLLAQEARTLGYDNSSEFKEAVRGAESGLIVKGLFRKELAGMSKKIDGEIEAGTKELMAKDKSLKPGDARNRAGQTVFEGKLAQIQTEITAAARKAFPAKVDQATIARIAKGEAVPDDAIIGEAGSEKMTYAQAKGLVEKATRGTQHTGKDFMKDEKVLASVVNQDLSNRSLLAYAQKQGTGKSPSFELDRSLLENAVLIGLLAEKVIFKGVTVSDKEIENTYTEHKEMFAKEGKVTPLAEVRGQISEFLLNGKKQKAIEAFLAPLKAKAKVTVTESLVSKI